MNPHSENHTTHTLAQNYAQRRTCTMRFLTENLSILLNIYSTSQSFPVVQPEVTWFTMFEWAKSARILNSVSTFSQEDILSERRTLWRKTVVSIVVYEAVLRFIAIHVCEASFEIRALQRMCKIDTFCRTAWYWGDRVGWLVEVELYGGGGDAAEWMSGCSWVSCNWCSWIDPPSASPSPYSCEKIYFAAVKTLSVGEFFKLNHQWCCWALP